MAAADKVVILDRDGTMVIDRGYLDDPAGLEFAPGAAEGLHRLHSHGYRLVVITNQSGVGRGFFTLERLEAMNARLRIMVENAGARLEGIYFCPHAPEAGCACRKPALGLLTQAASELGFDPSSAVMIGDKESDVVFGRRAGAMTILISGDASRSPGASTSAGRSTSTGSSTSADAAAHTRIEADLVARDLMEAAGAVISPRD